ncbi:FG-GAP-like repeat-containing protein [Streptomyces exfoliatus]|uniref:FG-GAP-like repeat-containing protein n=1 Tax=Streptomyces exfoliatus TaxID=1905 RepID=UPI003C2C8D13
MNRSTRARGRRRALGVTLAVLASSAALSAATAAPAQAAGDTPKPRVVFTEYTYVDGVRSPGTIVTVNTDGTDRRSLVPTGTGLPKAAISGVAFSPDGLRMAFIHHDGNRDIWVANADGTDARPVRMDLDVPEGRPHSLDWTADGRQLILSYLPTPEPGGDIYVEPPVYRVDVVGGVVRSAFPDAMGTQADVAWDGRITFVRGDRGFAEVHLWDPRADGEPRPVAQGVHPVFSPNGERIAFAEAGGGDTRVRVLNGGEYDLIKGEGATFGAEWSPDGSEIAYRTDGQAIVRSAEPGSPRTVLSAPGALADEISWIPPRGWNPHGTFRHDYNGDGRPDVLALDGAGVLWRYDGTGTGALKPRVKVGWGWKGYRLTAAGDLNADGRPDALAQDATGGLWRLDGTAGGVFAAKVKIGTGWKGLKLTGVGDLTADGWPDVLAIDPSGNLWEYAGNGRGGLQARQKAGYGYGGYRLTGIGAFTASGHQNYLGQTPSGDLYRYEWGGRHKIGWGWKNLTLTGAGDLNGDGISDVLARDTAGVLWRYDGDGTGGLKARVKVGWGWNGLSTF